MNGDNMFLWSKVMSMWSGIMIFCIICITHTAVHAAVISILFRNFSVEVEHNSDFFFYITCHYLTLYCSSYILNLTLYPKIWALWFWSIVDVAGGYSASMLDAIRKTMIMSNGLKINKINEEGLTIKEVFRLATLGGSQGKETFYSL